MIFTYYGACEATIDIIVNNKEDIVSKYTYLNILLIQIVNPWSNECLTKFYEFRERESQERKMILINNPHYRDKQKILQLPGTIVYFQYLGKNKKKTKAI